MADVFRGTTRVTSIRKGSTVVNEVRKGSTLVWSSLVRGDNFDRDDCDELTGSWTDLGPSDDHVLGIENGMCRVIVPDHRPATEDDYVSDKRFLLGILLDNLKHFIDGIFDMIGGVLARRTSMAIFTGYTAPSDDGYVEMVLGTLGDGADELPLFDFFATEDESDAPAWERPELMHFSTEVFGRATSSSGIGIGVIAGQCYIARMTGGVVTDVADGDSCQPGDLLRLTYTGTNHVLTVNGQVRASYTGTTTGGRSMVIRAQAGKKFLGPRRFSPSLDAVWML